MRLFIDAGHGGQDPGTVDPKRGLAEKELTLDMALALKWLAVKRGIAVGLSRAGDSYPALTERTRTARTFQADLFVSVHFDSPGGRSMLYYSGAADKRNDSKQLVRRVAAIMRLPFESSATSRFGRLYIDDAVMPALLWEVDAVDRASTSRDYRIEHAATFLTALVAAWTEES